MRKTIARLVAASAVALASTAASAATYVITYTGTVTGGSDQSGVFLTPGASFNGEAFTAVYTLDYPTPGAIESGASNASYHTYMGGSGFGAPSPLSGEITIEGTTRAFSGNFIGLVSQSNGAGSDEVSHNLADQDVDGTGLISNFLYLGVKSIGNDMFSTADFTALLDYTLDLDDLVTQGSFQLSHQDFKTSQYSELTYGDLTPARVTIAPWSATTAVPEPASWALMICGFGVVGLSVRRRRMTA